MTSYILVFAAQEIYAACVMIWNVLPPSRPPTVFRFSADQINVFIRCTFFGSRSPSAVHRRPLIMGCSALLSVVSQLLSVCNPADSLVRLQRGATPSEVFFRQVAFVGIEAVVPHDAEIAQGNVSQQPGKNSR